MHACRHVNNLLKQGTASSWVSVDFGACANAAHTPASSSGRGVCCMLAASVHAESRGLWGLDQQCYAPRPSSTAQMCACFFPCIWLVARRVWQYIAPQELDNALQFCVYDALCLQSPAGALLVLLLVLLLLVMQHACLMYRWA